MRGRRFPIALVAVVLLIVLGTVGVGYALWYDSLDLNLNVRTGTVDIGWSGPEVERCVDVYPYTGIVECQAVEGVDAACVPTRLCGDAIPVDKRTFVCSAEVKADGEMYIRAREMFPSATCKVTFDVSNKGTVPVHLFTQNISGTLPIPAWVEKTGKCFETNYQLDVSPTVPNTTGPCTLVIHFTNADGLPQATEWNYAVRFIGKQWNEAGIAIP